MRPICFYNDEYYDGNGEGPCQHNSDSEPKNIHSFSLDLKIIWILADARLSKR